VVLEEASTVSLALLAQLAAALQRFCPRLRRVVFVGDPNQLLPVDAGAPFCELVEYLQARVGAGPRSGLSPMVHLQQVHRFNPEVAEVEKEIVTPGVGLVPIASRVRAWGGGKEALEALEAQSGIVFLGVRVPFGSRGGGDTVEGPPRLSEVGTAALEVLKHAGEEALGALGCRVLVVTYTNAVRRAINAALCRLVLTVAGAKTVDAACIEVDRYLRTSGGGVPPLITGMTYCMKAPCPGNDVATSQRFVLVGMVGRVSLASGPTGGSKGKAASLDKAAVAAEIASIVTGLAVGTGRPRHPFVPGHLLPPPAKGYATILLVAWVGTVAAMPPPWVGPEFGARLAAAAVPLVVGAKGFGAPLGATYSLKPADLELGAGSTAHRAQGSQAALVVYVVESREVYVDSRSLLVGVTRAESHVKPRKGDKEHAPVVPTGAMVLFADDNPRNGVLSPSCSLYKMVSRGLSQRRGVLREALCSHLEQCRPRGPSRVVGIGVGAQADVDAAAAAAAVCSNVKWLLQVALFDEPEQQAREVRERQQVALELETLLRVERERERTRFRSPRLALLAPAPAPVSDEAGGVSVDVATPVAPGTN
jgi:hypothetical protein